MKLSDNLIQYTGKILFEPNNITKKHENQASWKRVAMVMLSGDICEYYAWFLKKRFNLEFIKPIRGAHITFINDSVNDIGENLGKWEELKNKWNGKKINIVLNTNYYSSGKHWWQIVDFDHRDELQSIRSEIGLGKPNFGLHMTVGIVNEKNLEFSQYLNILEKKGYIKFK